MTSISATFESSNTSTLIISYQPPNHTTAAGRNRFETADVGAGIDALLFASFRAPPARPAAPEFLSARIARSDELVQARYFQRSITRSKVGAQQANVIPPTAFTLYQRTECLSSIRR